MTICLFEKAKRFAEFGWMMHLLPPSKLQGEDVFLIAGHFQSWNAIVVNWVNYSKNTDDNLLVMKPVH